MTSTATSQVTGNPVPTEVGNPRTGFRMWASRLIGALFLAGFIVHGAGPILVTSVVDGPDFLAGVDSAGAEIFGAPISLVLLIPGGIFEVTLAIWLLTKGFSPEAYRATSTTQVAA